MKIRAKEVATKTHVAIEFADIPNRPDDAGTTMISFLTSEQWALLLKLNGEWIEIG